MHHSHNPFGAKKRCRWCLRKLTPNTEWNVWMTKSEVKKRQKMHDEWMDSLNR